MVVTRFGTMALALVGFLFGSEAFAGGKDHYTIHVKSVKVKETQKDGSSWDVDNGKPDLFVRINVDAEGAETFDTKVVDDTFAATFNETLGRVKFTPGQKLKIQVFDKDVAANDHIGTYMVTTTEKGVEGKSLILEDFGQVIRLELEYRKVGDSTK